ncbi:HNH endonuclease [[Clostridium] symbiosum]|uniref:HNH endonuclease n=1 Tax=Clostridium symbiosum TaxID=1512 RepID=UPI00210DCAB4|nr:HNH endonuclease [[Clostridium] symbiosum]MCQ4988452.1 HNH endonuclease [[Clostridium] symbiosum]
MKEYCIYCGKEIINQKRASNNKDYSQVFKSSEHIIQNALGGKLESEKICCDRCNYHMEKLVDKKFCVLFAALTSKIEGLKKLIIQIVNQYILDMQFIAMKIQRN